MRRRIRPIKSARWPRVRASGPQRSFSGAADVQAPAGPLKRPSDRAEVRRVTRASRLFFGLVGAAVVVYFFLPAGEQTILYDLIALSAGGAMLAGVRRYRPDPLPAWT